MKKIHFAITFVFLLLSVTFIGYGTYLNAKSNSYIETMLESRAVSLSGIEVSYRDLYPVLYLDHVGLRARMQADAIAHIDGLIEELYVTQGQEVTQGQLLGRIVNKDVPLALSRAETDVAKADAAYLQAMSVVERNRRLAAEDAVSVSELEMSVSQMEASKAELDAARIARRQIEQQRSDQMVTAPLSGSVIVAYQQPGNFVSVGMPVLMIADFSKMHFTAMVDDIKVKNIAPLEGKFSLLTDLTNLTETAFDSAVTSSFSEDTAFDVRISSVLPPFSEDVPVRTMTFEIDNSLGVMEFGMYTDIIIRKETPKRALAIPLAVVFDREGDPRVHARDENSHLAVRSVRLGMHDGEYVEVAEGLEEGDVVITSRVEGLEPGMRVDVNLREDL